MIMSTTRETCLEGTARLLQPRHRWQLLPARQHRRGTGGSCLPLSGCSLLPARLGPALRSRVQSGAAFSLPAE